MASMDKGSTHTASPRAGGSGGDKLAFHQLKPTRAAPIELASDAFRHGATIPRDYTQDGSNVSPPLRWANLPREARELVLLCEDPDAPSPAPFVHWIAYGISPDTTSLPAGIGHTKEVRKPHLHQSVNDMRGEGYGGPAPPKGHGVHHYHFQLFALDAPLHLKDSPSRNAIIEAMRGHVIACGDLVGTYERS